MKPWIRDATKEMLHRSLGGRFIWRLPGSPPNRYCLTFDDGPDPMHTPALLAKLERLGVRATFFLVGNRVEQHPGLVREILRRGHAVGTHTQTHCEIPRLDRASLARELDDARRAVREATGTDTFLFRPPRGRVSLASIQRVVRLGYVLVHWTKTYSDYRPESTDALLDRLRRQPVHSRDIVLLHDNNPHTLEALDSSVPELRLRGLEPHPGPWAQPR